MNKIAIMMRINLVAEDLNNEGGIGNTIQPRQITVNEETRQAISGEMLKHFHTKNLRLLADENELCETCKIFSPMKNGQPKVEDKELSPSGNKVKNCIVDDIEGFMDAGGNKNSKRTSCIKFSWAVATKENEYENMLHTRVDSTQSGGKKKSEKVENNEKEVGNENTKQNTQMLFYRPLRSNEYALTIQVDLDRIGFDDEKLKYVFDEDTIKARQGKCLKAIENMFLDMEGALCSTRLPHILGVEGIVVIKNNKDEVLSKYSALNNDYMEVNKAISNNTKEFKNIEEFTKVIENLIQ